MLICFELETDCMHAFKFAIEKAMMLICFLVGKKIVHFKTAIAMVNGDRWRLKVHIAF